LNLYATLNTVKDLLNESGTDRDTRIMMHLQSSSRMIDACCHRVFWTEIGTRYFDGRQGRVQYIDDFLGVTAVTTDSERDNTFDGETWTEGTDFTTWPDNSLPKLGLAALPDGNYAWRELERYVKVTGTWGYGDGKSASPWTALDESVTLADGSTTSMTLNDDNGVVQPGMTLLVEEEQVYVAAVGSGTATVMRAMNGTDAAAHTAQTPSVAQYPALIVQTCATLAVTLMERATRLGLESESMDDYSYKMANDRAVRDFVSSAVSSFVRPVV
jgi:hypothetical protein